THKNDTRSWPSALHGPSRRAYLRQARPDGDVLWVLDGEGRWQEVARWPEANLRDLRLDAAGDLLALLSERGNQFAVERLAPLGARVSELHFSAPLGDPEFVVGVDEPVLAWRAAVGRVRAGEPLAAAASLDFWPINGALDSQGAV